MLLPTLSAAVALEPAHETWVLDDGGRPWVAELAAALGVRYRARETHEHAKAGNLNAALDDLDVDLIAVLDADHVANAGLLRDTLGYFDDPRVALVQTPQDFYNLDSFEHVDRPGGRRYMEQDLFYRGIEAGRNRWKAAFWCGTNAIVRLSALRDVGGVATETVTEDIHTTIRLHRRGWRTVYHNAVLARGLAASDSAQYLGQRVRWGTGAMQVLRTENPAFVSGLTVAQRLSYLSTLLGWFESWRTLGYTLLPLITVVTGAMPIVAPLSVFLPTFVGVLVLQRLALTALGRGRAPVWQSTLFEFVRLPANLQATTGAVPPQSRRLPGDGKGSLRRAADPNAGAGAAVGVDRIERGGARLVRGHPGRADRADLPVCVGGPRCGVLGPGQRRRPGRGGAADQVGPLRIRTARIRAIRCARSGAARRPTGDLARRQPDGAQRRSARVRHYSRCHPVTR